MTFFFKKHTFKILLLTGFFIFFHHLSQPGFFLDGIIYAALGKNALIKGAWLVPTMNDSIYKTYSDSIPSLFIIHGIFFKLFGVSFFTARLVISLFAFSVFSSLIYVARKKVSNFHVILIAFLFLLTYPLLRHARHPNYDIPLMLFCFLSIHFYLKAIANNRKQDWYSTGLFFGLAMLLKGPMAIFVPLTIIIHLFVTKRLKLLLTWTPWLAILLGLALFSLWPFALYLDGNFPIFLQWFNYNFLGSILGARGVSTNDYFSYVRYLITYTPIHIVLLLYSFYKLYRTKWSEFYQVHFIFFFVVLILTSLMKFKLAHYITCLYTSLPIIACMGVQDVVKDKIYVGFLTSMLLISAVVFIYPQDPTKTRDYEIFEIRRVLLEKKLTPSRYFIETNAYPYASLYSLIEFLDGLRTDVITLSQPQLFHPQALYIVTKPHKNEFTLKCSFIYDLTRYNSEAYFCPKSSL